MTWFQVYLYYSKHCKHDKLFLKYFVGVQVFSLVLRVRAFKVSRLGRTPFVRLCQCHRRPVTHLEQYIGFAAVGLDHSRVLCARDTQFWRLLGRSYRTVVCRVSHIARGRLNLVVLGVSRSKVSLHVCPSPSIARAFLNTATPSHPYLFCPPVRLARLGLNPVLTLVQGFTPGEFITVSIS